MKRINLKDEYMNPADFRFYTTDWAPNGTTTLIIANSDGTVVGAVDEALFGPPLDHNRNGAVFDSVHYCDGESVWTVENSDEFAPDDVVYPLLIDDVLSSIATSPVQSRMDVLRSIVSIIKS